ncbi:MAG: ribosome small subunit-dependent GTPase A, partial [Leptolyngbya sp. SIO1D8]|nr:ribosome small subunit-dependent GTPase A [Leptolyngbya sp. SIO1D8]
MTTSAIVGSTSADGALWGTVVSVQANYYWVKLDPIANQVPFPKSTLLCTRRARLKKVGQRVMVGDRVLVEQPDWEGNRGAISAVKPREAQLDRPPIANANQILLVFALAEPDLDPHQLTRFLVRAELTGLDVCLCLNKRDLVDSKSQTDWHMRLAAWGYLPIMISVWHDKAFASLTQALQGRITVVSGPSGVGKSSLINKLIPAIDLRINAVSGKLGLRRHAKMEADHVGTELFDERQLIGTERNERF